MNKTVISVEHLSKAYRLGQIGTGTLSHDLNVWWAKVQGKPNPLLRIGEIDHGNRDSETIWALKDVSFEVEQGDVLGIIGRNGAGKSTLLKILGRVTAPTSGKVKVKGRVASLLEVGTGFHPELTGRENIYLNGAILGMSRKEIDRKFDEIVDFSGVEQFIDTPVKRYSSGMYVRLAFAVAAHLEPEILLVDEVLAVGDAEFQKKCLGKMGNVAAEGRTILLVSHNLKSISSLASRCAYIAGGSITGIGETDYVINKYMEQLNTLIPGEGWADLSGMQRGFSLAGRRAQFTWVRLLDSQNRQIGIFRETEPITVELGFQVMESVRDLQFGCSFWTFDGSVELFTIPSKEYIGIVKAGNYSVRTHLDPNYLRQGEFTFAVKMFAAGQRQDTIGPVIKVTIQPFSSSDDNLAYSHGWVAGYIRYDCEWESIQAERIA
jgi:lipopolysaccharide transport system ATP-binding protein